MEDSIKHIVILGAVVAPQSCSINRQSSLIEYSQVTCILCRKIKYNNKYSRFSQIWIYPKNKMGEAPVTKSKRVKTWLKTWFSEPKSRSPSHGTIH